MSRNCSVHHGETQKVHTLHLNSRNGMQDILADMLPFMVDVPNVDESPEAV